MSRTAAPVRDPTGRTRLKSLVFWLNRIIDTLLVGSMIVITTVLVMQVVFRYLFHAALPWPEELSQFLLVAIAFLGMYRAFGKDLHIRIDWLPKQMKVVRLVKALGLLLVGGFLAYVGVGGWELAMGAWNQPSTALRVPMAIPYLIIPLACLISLFAVMALLRTTLAAPTASKDLP